jgi:hypothetical protein
VDEHNLGAHDTKKYAALFGLSNIDFPRRGLFLIATQNGFFLQCFSFLKVAPTITLNFAYLYT